MKNLIALMLFASAMAGPVAVADDAEMFDQARSLMAAAETETHGLTFVEDLTTEIGQRLAGSEDEARARDWSVARLKALSFDTVRIEPFEIPYWKRLTERAEITSHGGQSLVITALGGSAPTPTGGVEGQVIRFTSLAALNAAGSAQVKGKIVFIDEVMTRNQDGSGYGLAVRKRRDCAAATVERGGLACLIRSVGTQHHRFAHTGMMTRKGMIGTGTAAALSPPDADQLARLATRGPVTVKVDIQVETREAAPSGNVVAELRGRETPDEIVLIGCHLDSWDLGTGALDDGAGCGIVVGAAKLIEQSGLRPKRTIRVVLFGSEEVGLLGARAYAKEHADNIGKHVLAWESDFGAGRIWRLQTRFGSGALDHAAAMQKLLEPIGVSPGNNEAGGGPDIIPLRMSGVPVITPGQDGLDYFDYHHTPDDTFDKIDPDAFRQNVAVYAALAYVAAESGWDFRADVVDAAGTE